MSSEKQEWLAAARAAIEIESAALARAAAHLDDQLVRAVEVVLAHPGKIVLTGIGKSGHIARKIVATLCSTGTPAVFLHPSEAVHGDLGIYTQGDPTVLLSKNGSSRELLALVPVLRELRSPLIGILGSKNSPLAQQMDIVLDASVEREADPYNMAPTASAIAAMALGHALAIALMSARRFTPQEFSRFHPGGQLGRNLLLAVREAMHSGDEVATVQPGASLKDVIIAMTRRPMGRSLRGRRRWHALRLHYRWRPSPRPHHPRRYPRSPRRRRHDLQARYHRPRCHTRRSFGAHGAAQIADLGVARGG